MRKLKMEKKLIGFQKSKNKKIKNKKNKKIINKNFLLNIFNNKRKKH